jgi:hypothetical protein
MAAVGRRGDGRERIARKPRARREQGNGQGDHGELCGRNVSESSDH